jgi:eukaryotic-like serine/threonine-protein kinase
VTLGASTRSVGAIFDEQYELLAELGSGQFGEVWRVHDQRLNRVVALKLLKDADEAAAWAEGQRLVELDSPHILPIYSAGLAIDVPYLVMEYAPGGTVADLFASGPLTPWRAVNMTRAVLGGLELAHRRRILHRDVKPANIFIRSTGDAQLGDFGVAAIMDVDDSAKGYGDLDVRAPETFKGARATAASDVYSAGVSLWAMLTGHLPIEFDESKGFAPHKAAVLAGVPDIRDAAPGVSLTLAKVLRKACAVSAKDRYSTVAEFDAALGRLKQPSADVTVMAPHPGHRECWRVRRLSDGHVHTVCVEPTDATHAEVIVRHEASGNRVSDLCRAPGNDAKVLVGLRRAFDALA